MSNNTENLPLYAGGEIPHVDLSLLQGGEEGGDVATLTVRAIFRYGKEPAIYQCIDDCYGREHEVTEAQIRRAA